MVRRVSTGDQKAISKLMPVVYDELRRLARRYVRRERDTTLQATALVHEAYLRLAKDKKQNWQGRTHFLAITAIAMRRILVERARARAASKRGGSRTRITLDESLVADKGKPVDLDWDEGCEYLYEGSATWKRLVSFGFYLRGWQTVPYVENRSIGRFEGTRFDPETWKPRAPTTAILNARADDTFWAAQRVMAFSDELIRGLVQVGEYGDPAAAQLLADVLIARRDRLGEAYLPAINPIMDVALDPNGVLTFGNAAVEAGVAAAPGQGYRGEWYLFDNATPLRPLPSGNRPLPRQAEWHRPPDYLWPSARSSVSTSPRSSRPMIRGVCRFRRTSDAPPRGGGSWGSSGCRPTHLAN